MKINMSAHNIHTMILHNLINYMLKPNHIHVGLDMKRVNIGVAPLTLHS